MVSPSVDGNNNHIMKMTYKFIPKKIIKITKRLLAGGLALATVGVFCLLAGNIYVKRSSMNRIFADNEKPEIPQIDCILILGCGLRPDGEPTQMLKDRLDMGIALYQSGTAPKILVSGDHGRIQYDEVNRMKQYSMDAGVPSQDIFMDHAGFSTYESMYRARDVFQVKRAIVVTQEYHLYRALYDGKQLGLEVWGVPAKKIRYGGQKRRDVREVLARNKDILYCLFQPEPKYLGEAIPVSGNGDLTND